MRIGFHLVRGCPLNCVCLVENEALSSLTLRIVKMTLHKHGGTTRRKSVRKRIPKHLKKKVSAKIHKLKHEGKSQDQAIAQGINQTLNESKKRK